MIVTKTPVIIPTRLDWLALLAMIGIFGFIAQVRVVISSSTQTEIGKFFSPCGGASDDGLTTRDRWKRDHGSLHPSIVSLLIYRSIILTLSLPVARLFLQRYWREYSSTLFPLLFR